jgi:peptide/nickel transport system substrate-binding protein
MRGLALLTLAALLGGCTKVGTTSDAGGDHAYTRPHELRFASAEDLVGLNPMVNSQAVLSYLSSLTMAWLIRTDAHSEPTVPELATAVPSKANGGISPDGKTITWHLRHGVVWSDGVPFTADDVVFSTKLILDKHTNVVSLDGWDQIVKIDEPDKYTVVYHLKAPYAPFSVTYFSTAGANPAILPKHLLAGKDVNTDPYNALPVGIGPFKYEAWNRGDSVVMVANDTYWRGKPKLQRITYKTIQDRNTVLEQMRTHELDLWTPVPPHYYNDLKKIPGIKLLATPSYFYDHMDFNNAHPVMADHAVRQALRMAIDRKLLNDKIRFGIYDLGESVVPPVSRFHANIPMTPFDIAGANRVLDAAGWKRGADGIRSKNGLRLSLDFATSSGTPDNDTEIELIRGWWKQLGAEITVKHYLSSLFFALASNGGIIYGGKFDVVMFAWGGDPNQDLSNLYACYRFPPNGQNDLRYCNPAVSAEIDRGKVEYDRAKRVAGMAFAQRQIASDVPTIVLDTRKQIYAYNDDIKGWQPNPVAPFDDFLGVDI